MEQEAPLSLPVLKNKHALMAADMQRGDVVGRQCRALVLQSAWQVHWAGVLFPQETQPSDKPALIAQVEIISGVLQAHAHGREAYTRQIASGLLQQFLDVEAAFQGSGDTTEQEIIDGLRKVCKRQF